MSSSDPLEIQRVIHPGRLLGEGGMGRVIDGFAPDLGQYLAVKQLRAEWMEDGEVRSRFEEEAAIMASIDHPGVLPVYGIGLDEERRHFYVMNQIPDPPRRTNWLLPRDLNAVCLKALHKEPSRRYADAGLLADDLRAHLEGRPVTAIRPNPVERLRYAARRHPMRALVSTSMICGVAAVAGFILSQRWLDHRLTDKAMERIRFIENEITAIDRESAEFRERLSSPALPEKERLQIMGELEVNDSRWILAQFEAQRTLNSVTELRFIRTDPEIVRSARQRLIDAIEACIHRGHPALGQAVAETYLDRVAEGALVTPITKDDIERIQSLSRKAAAARVLPKP